jgi:signal peptidase I
MDKYFNWLKDKNQTWGGFFLETFVLILIVLFIRFYVFQLFRVSGSSMCPTLNQFDQVCERGPGEFIFVNEFQYNFIRSPKRGEIVVVTSPNTIENKFLKALNNVLPFEIPTKIRAKYIKRVIGKPGDTIQVEAGKVYLTNDLVTRYQLPEAYLSAMNSDRTYARQSQYVVPEDHVLVFGDNRTGSQDSRSCFGDCAKNSAFIHKRDVVGKATATIWPSNRLRLLDNTIDYDIDGE